VKVLEIVKETMKEIMANIERLGFSFIFSFVAILWHFPIISVVVCKSHKFCLRVREKIEVCGRYHLEFYLGHLAQCGFECLLSSSAINCNPHIVSDSPVMNLTK